MKQFLQCVCMASLVALMPITLTGCGGGNKDTVVPEQYAPRPPADSAAAGDEGGGESAGQSSVTAEG